MVKDVEFRRAPVKTFLTSFSNFLISTSACILGTGDTDRKTKLKIIIGCFDSFPSTFPPLCISVILAGCCDFQDFHVTNNISFLEYKIHKSSGSGVLIAQTFCQ